MKRTTKAVLLMVLIVLLLASFAGCNQEKTNAKTGNPLQIQTAELIPSAYLDEVFDLREIMELEDGVQYSAKACYDAGHRRAGRGVRRLYLR